MELGCSLGEFLLPVSVPRMHCRVYALLGFPILLTSSPPKDSEVEQSKLLARAAPALLKGKG